MKYLIGVKFIAKVNAKNREEARMKLLVELKDKLNKSDFNTIALHFKSTSKKIKK